MAKSACRRHKGSSKKRLEIRGRHGETLKLGTSVVALAEHPVCPLQRYRVWQCRYAGWSVVWPGSGSRDRGVALASAIGDAVIDAAAMKRSWL